LHKLLKQQKETDSFYSTENDRSNFIIVAKTTSSQPQQKRERQITKDNKTAVFEINKAYDMYQQD
jgi:hypothetical protein